MLATFLRDITATFLSVTDTYIRTYAHHENRSRIRKLTTLAIIAFIYNSNIYIGTWIHEYIILVILLIIIIFIYNFT